MTEQREPSSRLWVSSRWHWLLVVVTPSLPFLVWGLIESLAEGSSALAWVSVLAVLLAMWWLPLIAHYATILKSSRVWIERDELVIAHWRSTRRIRIDDDLRLRATGVIGRSMGVDALGSFNVLTAFASIMEGIFGPLTREKFELTWKIKGRSSERILFLHPARFKTEGEPFQPGMRALHARLAEFRTARKEALAAADASKLSELEQAREDEREARAELTDRARATRNPIKRMRELRKKSK